MHDRLVRVPSAKLENESYQAITSYVLSRSGAYGNILGSSQHRSVSEIPHRIEVFEFSLFWSMAAGVPLSTEMDIEERGFVNLRLVD